jgi:hypothetical protein
VLPEEPERLDPSSHADAAEMCDRQLYRTEIGVALLGEQYGDLLAQGDPVLCKLAEILSCSITTEGMNNFHVCQK